MAARGGDEAMVDREAREQRRVALRLGERDAFSMAGGEIDTDMPLAER